MGKPLKHVISETQKYSELEHELLTVLNDQSIHTLYQPIIELDSGNVMGYEALTRGPVHSILHSPLQLFTIADQFGELHTLERLAQEKAILNARLDSMQQLLFINISSKMINASELISLKTLEALHSCGYNPHNIVFEITEQSSVDDFAKTRQFLEYYRNQGYRIAIDDVGAGYSSINTIAQLCPDYIKFDRSLIQNIHQDRMKECILEAFVTFTNKMNISLIAEGIELEEELIKLVRMGVKYAQGYLLARPHQNPSVIPSHIVEIILQNRIIT
ncbi:MAG TPA: EAL domain-containing protein [Candidatus Paenibacillus intestinavium]|nr:EAL domain-containing protein [Candidatus Paenibacillus intestinavium]